MQDFHVIFVLQPKPQFQPSSKGGQNTSGSTSSSAKPASEPVEQPLSYAEYIVRKNNAAALEGSSKLLNADDAGETNGKQSESDSGSSAAVCCDPLQGRAEGGEGESGGVKTSEDPQVAGTHQKEGNCQRSDRSNPYPGPKTNGVWEQHYRQSATGMHHHVYASSLIHPLHIYIPIQSHQVYVIIC